jgi:hypothetical protein
MADQDIPKRSIWRTLTKKKPDKKLIPKDIHNVVQRIIAERESVKIQCSQLENLLVEKLFTYYTCENQTTNTVEDIFFVHRHSLLCGVHSRMC